jgi:hypothetical protein
VPITSRGIGSEENIGDCKIDLYEDSYCDHNDDAGVICNSGRYSLFSKNVDFLFYCSNIAKSENVMLWRMLSRLETCIIYSCI